MSAEGRLTKIYPNPARTGNHSGTRTRKGAVMAVLVLGVVVLLLVVAFAMPSPPRRRGSQGLEGSDSAVGVGWFGGGGGWFGDGSGGGDCSSGGGDFGGGGGGGDGGGGGC